MTFSEIVTRWVNDADMVCSSGDAPLAAWGRR